MVSHFQSHVLIHITIFFFLFLHSLSPTKANLVPDICKGASNPPSCLSAFKQIPKASSETNLKALAKITLNFAASNTSSSQKFVEDMAQKTTEPTLKAALQYCADQFRGTVGQFKVTIQELDDDVPTASYDIMIAQDGAKYCEEKLANSRLKVDSVSTRNGYIFLFCDIANVMIDKLS